MQAAIARGRALDKWSGRFSEIVGNMPTSYFGIVLGLAGLGNAWRGAERTWQLPKFIEDWIYLIAGAVWAVLVAIYVLKALLMPDKLPAVVTHSFQCCCIGLAGVATMLVAGGLAPDARTSACVVFGIGFASTLFFAVGPTAASRVADIGKMFDALQRAEPRQPERPRKQDARGNENGQPEQCPSRAPLGEKAACHAEISLRSSRVLRGASCGEGGSPGRRATPRRWR